MIHYLDFLVNIFDKYRKCNIFKMFTAPLNDLFVYDTFKFVYIKCFILRLVRDQ